MEMKCSVLLLLLSASCLGASEPPDAPSHGRRFVAIFTAEAVGYGAFNLLDGIYTVRATNRGLIEDDFPNGTPFFLGRHPSAARYALTFGAVEAVTTFAAYKLERSRRRPLRLLGHALMLQGIYMHLDGYRNELRVLGGTDDRRKP